MAENIIEYEYQAVDSQGKRKKGFINAPSDTRAYQLLQLQGLNPLKVTAKSNNVMKKEITIPGFEKKAKLKDLAVFARQFALLIRSGMPMLESLKVASTQTDDTVLKKALEDVIEDIEKGLSLSKAMKKQDKAFPPLFTSVIAVGEEGGFLDRSLDAMAKTYKIELELKQKIKSAMTYPVVVISISVLVLGGMMIFVVPTFAEMFENMNAELPAITQGLVNISSNAVVVIPSTAALTVVLIFIYRKVKYKVWVQSKVDFIKLKAPVFGDLNTKVAVARFSRNLSMMLSSGVNLIPALRLVASTANNYHISKAIENSVSIMENGQAFSSSIEGFTMFPPMVKQMIVVGERSGSLSAMLESVADFYDDEVREASDSLAASLEPILLVVLGGLVGGMLFALYTPMFSLFSQMSEG